MIRAAVVGLGWWGKIMVSRLAGSADLRIVHAVDANPALGAFAKEHGLAFSTDLGAVLAAMDIDAVILCTPHAMHTAQVLACAEVEHVFCEKPLALTRADAERSVAACRKAGVMLGIGHERRFQPALAEVRRLVQSGALGTIMHVEANFSHDKLANVPAGDWRLSPKDAPAAGMTAMGIHSSDGFIDMLGPISEVYASTTSRVAFKQTGDVVSVHVRFACGATGVPQRHPGHAALHRADGVRLEGVGGGAQPHPPRYAGPRNADDPACRWSRRETRDLEWIDTVRENVELFAKACAGRAVYPFTDVQKIANIAALEAICRSAATNLPVPVAPVLA